jgi:hypothetical protein
MPLQNSTIKLETAKAMRKRGRDIRATTARHGGNLARADFHVTPPFGSSMMRAATMTLKPRGSQADRGGLNKSSGREVDSGTGRGRGQRSGQLLSRNQDNLKIKNKKEIRK